MLRAIALSLLLVVAGVAAVATPASAACPEDAIYCDDGYPGVNDDWNACKDPLFGEVLGALGLC